MQYLLTEEDMKKLKNESELVGFRKCERLMGQVLEGERCLMITTDIDERTGKYISKPIQTEPDNVWVKLINRLDKK